MREKPRRSKVANGYFQQVGKLLKVVDCLARPQGARIEDLRNALDCDERTVYRWINILEDMGFPLEKVKANGHKRYRLIDSYVKKLPNISIPDFQLSFSDILLLYVVLSQDRLTRGTHMQERMDKLLKRLSAMLSEKEQKLAEAIERLVVSNLKPKKDYSEKEEIIEVLTEAILQRRRCSVLYRSFSKKRDVRFGIHPLHFFESQGGLYVLVQLAEMNEPPTDVLETLRTLAVERIREIHKTAETFEYPKGVNAADLLARAFDVIWDDPVEVTVWFSESAAPYIKERVWPGQYTVEDQEDRSIIFHLKTSGYDDVKRWVLSFGKDAKVLAPRRLREDIAEICQAMAQEYAKTCDGVSGRWTMPPQSTSPEIGTGERDTAPESLRS